MEAKTIEEFEHIKTCFNAEMTGKQLQRYVSGGWISTDFEKCRDLYGFSSMFKYVRIKPELKRIPFTLADLPWDKQVWVKLPSYDVAFIIMAKNEHSIRIGTVVHTYINLMENQATWSTDGTTWLPFYKEVQA